jgi:hypothetical protein
MDGWMDERWMARWMIIYGCESWVDEWMRLFLQMERTSRRREQKNHSTLPNE